MSPAAREFVIIPRPQATIWGIVTSIERPVYGAQVEAIGRDAESTFTDSSGQFALELSCEREHKVIVMVSKAGYCREEREISIRAGETAEVEISLRECDLVWGYVLDQHDVPVNQAKVGLWTEASTTQPVTVETNQSGMFLITDFDLSNDISQYDIRIRPPSDGNTWSGRMSWPLSELSFPAQLRLLKQAQAYWDVAFLVLDDSGLPKEIDELNIRPTRYSVLRSHMAPRVEMQGARALWSNPHHGEWEAVVQCVSGESGSAYFTVSKTTVETLVQVSVGDGRLLKGRVVGCDKQRDSVYITTEPPGVGEDAGSDRNAGSTPGFFVARRQGADWVFSAAEMPRNRRVKFRLHCPGYVGVGSRTISARTPNQVEVIARRAREFRIHALVEGGSPEMIHLEFSQDTGWRDTLTLFGPDIVNGKAYSLPIGSVQWSARYGSQENIGKESSSSGVVDVVPGQKPAVLRLEL